MRVVGRAATLADFCRLNDAHGQTGGTRRPANHGNRVTRSPPTGGEFAAAVAGLQVAGQVGWHDERLELHQLHRIS